jgi:hypothetical protein
MRNITVEFRAVIAKLEENQKNLKARANASCAQDGEAQCKLIGTTWDLFVNYTAYYIVKHNLYTKNLADAFIEETIKKATKVFNDGGETTFKNKVMELVVDYESRYNNEEALRAGE